MNEADSTLAEPVPAPKRGDEDFDASAELAERRNVLTAADGLLGRRRLLALVDEGSFHEIGTFASADGLTGHGDGKVGGTARIGGRPVMVAADEPGVHSATAARIGHDRMDRLMDLAMRKGMPFVYLAGGGDLRADEADAEGLAELGAFDPFVTRCRQVPMIAVALGDTSGASAVIASLADVVIQAQGARLSLSRVEHTGVEGAGPAGSAGSADANAINGVIDIVVDEELAALETVRRLLSFLPSSAWDAPPRDGSLRAAVDPDDTIEAVVPRRRQRAYDIRRLVERIVDAPLGSEPGTPGELLELRPRIGRGLVTGFARIDGHPVAVFASNPLAQAGAMDPAACEKGVRLLVMCDAFQIPAVFLQDVAGFLVGRQVEHGRMLFRAVRFLNALYGCSAPTLTVVVRKAFGLAYEALNGRKHHTDGLYAWPGAEFGFMDPAVGVNVLYGDRKTKEEKAAIVADMKESTSPYGAAAEMNIDEIIDPAATRQVLARDLALLEHRRKPDVEDRPLRVWPTY